MKSYSERLADAKSIHQQGLDRVASTPAPKGQKYLPGTFVWIDKDLGHSMSHFENNRAALVQYTYGHAYPWNRENTDDYSLLVRYDNGKWSSVAWYHEGQLTEITDKKAIEIYKKEISEQKK